MLKDSRAPSETRALRDIVKGVGNTPEKEILANVRANIRRQLPQAAPALPQDYRILLVGGGPSSALLLPEIKRRRKAGWKLVTLNNAHEWVQDQGLEPSAHIMLDARKFNARFVKRPVESCRYLIASQCHPAAFEALEGHDVHIWHAQGEDVAATLHRFYLKRWQPILGGTSVGTRALWLLYVLGMRKIACYGIDSCLIGGEHHAYEQPENDGAQVCRVRVGRRIFRATPWMLKQADELLQMALSMPADLRLDWRGDGMIAYMVKQTAERGEPPKMTITG